MNILFTALGLGLMTSFHCIGMCGAIAIALPLNRKSKGTQILSALFYNFGRVITYSILGFIFGLVGTGFQLAGMQKWISISMGVFMIATVIFPKINSMLYKGNGNSFVIIKVKNLLSVYFRQYSYKSLFITGLLNGLLPCGMVYMALAGALAMSSLFDSVLFMILFGVGTIPSLFMMSLIGNFVSQRLKYIINRIIPIVVIIIGLLFILRGMDLGIKYISPPSKALEIHQNNTQHCH